MEICKQFKIDAAHTVLGAYTQKCDRTVGGIHGHTYKINVFLKSTELNAAGMVVDFTEIKELLNDFIDSFDHGLMIYANDKDLLDFGRMLTKRYVVLPYNPTAELMALHFFDQIDRILEKAGMCNRKSPGLLSRIDVYETETSFATVTRLALITMDNVTVDSEAVLYSPAVASLWKNPISHDLLKVDTFKPEDYKISLSSK